MTPERIKELRKELEEETIDLENLWEIEEAFMKLPDAVLRDQRENAMASDMLDELEDNIPTDGCQFEQEEEDVWLCVIHGAHMVGKQEPNYCIYKLEEMGL